MKTKVQLRRDTTVNWNRLNPTLLDGEIGIDTTLGKFKIGDGISDWKKLAFFASTDSGTEVDPTNLVDRELSNLKLKGIDRLVASKMYKTGEILDDPMAYHQLLDMKHSTFDKSKFTVVGSPTITDDGIASGFSSENKIITTGINITEQDDWEMSVCYQLASPDDTTQYHGTILSIGGEQNVGNKLYIYEHAHFETMYLVFKDWDKGSVTFNLGKQDHNLRGTFKLIFGVKGNVHYCNLYYEGILKNSLKQESTVKFVATPEVPIYIGYYPGVWHGTIDLRYLSIVVHGKELFNGNKTGIDIIKPDNFIKVGNPVISDDGVASGFSKDSLIKTIKFNPEDFSWKVNFTATLAEKDVNTRTNKYLLYTGGDTGLIIVFLSSNAQNDKIQVIIPFEDKNVEPIGYVLTMNGKAKAGDKISTVLKYDRNNNKYIFEVFKNESLWGSTILNGTTSVLRHTGSQEIYLGGRLGNTAFLNGSIDLNALKIYIDGKLVYQPLLRIPYNPSGTGSKIVDAQYRDRVKQVQEENGKALYYTIDTEKENLSLPAGEIYGMMVDRDLNSLTETGRNKTLDGRITNCITEIPQNINVSLDADSLGLTLKKGSKLYDIQGNFLIIPKDISSRDYSQAGDQVNQSLFVVAKDDVSKVCFFSVAETQSGESYTLTGQYRLWYDTKNNVIKFSTDTGSTWHECYLPICSAIFKDPNGIKQINQIFNGFGYFNSTIFVLPGVKGLMADGINDDGTLKNKEYIFKNVRIRDLTSESSYYHIYYGHSDFVGGWGGEMKIQEEAPTPNTHILWYKPSENTWRICENNGVYKKTSILVFARMIKYVGLENKIISYTPNRPFRALDYNNLSDFVVDYRLNTDGSWYRRYKSGWLEQGGYFNGGGGGWQGVKCTYLKPFKDTKYQLICLGNWSGAESSSCRITAKRTTGADVTVANNTSGAQNNIYYAQGQGA